ncbi:MAG TPA: hypothetical protein V6D25_24270 [Leptolyngbyaceae cyanobacterium]
MLINDHLPIEKVQDVSIKVLQNRTLFSQHLYPSSFISAPSYQAYNSLRLISK